MKHRKAIAVDFDGCLCMSAWPAIGAPNWDVIQAAQAEQRAGAALILWTSRWGVLLDDAVAWCREHGLEFDAVNANLPERAESFGYDSRKVSADEYWDDRAVPMPAAPNAPLTLEQLKAMDGEPAWCTFADGRQCWVLLRLSPPDTPSAPGCEYLLWEEYGTSWTAYRRRPGEV